MKMQNYWHPEFIVMIPVLIWILICLAITAFKEPTKCPVVNWDVIADASIMERKYGQFEQVLREVRSHEYTEGYKCLEFSRDLQAELKDIGIDSEVVIGQSVSDSTGNWKPHAWVSVWIEPLTGYFISPYEGYVK